MNSVAIVRESSMCTRRLATGRTGYPRVLCGLRGGRDRRRSWTTMNAVPNITLNDGNTIPQLGFGVFQIEPENTVEAVSEALQIGYRHVDTAEMYGNEQEVGEAIRSSGLDRGEVFVTSKLTNGAHEPQDA